MSCGLSRLPFVEFIGAESGAYLVGARILCAQLYGKMPLTKIFVEVNSYEIARIV